jgi:hypothetical protein
MKGVTNTAVFILVAIGLFIFAGLVIFWKWFGWAGVTTNEFFCGIKQQSYCKDLVNKENPNWDEIAPKTGCEQFGVVKPTLDECKGLVK